MKSTSPDGYFAKDSPVGRPEAICVLLATLAVGAIILVVLRLPKEDYIRNARWAFPLPLLLVSLYTLWKGVKTRAEGRRKKSATYFATAGFLVVLGVGTLVVVNSIANRIEDIRRGDRRSSPRVM